MRDGDLRTVQTAFSMRFGSRLLLRDTMPLQPRIVLVSREPRLSHHLGPFPIATFCPPVRNPGSASAMVIAARLFASGSVDG